MIFANYVGSTWLYTIDQEQVHNFERMNEDENSSSVFIICYIILEYCLVNIE